MSILDPKIMQSIAPAIEKAINAALTMDPSAQKHLKRLQGCILEVQISSANRSFYFGVESVNPGQSDRPSYQVKINTNDSDKQAPQFQVVLMTDSDTSSVQIKGSALSFIKLASYQKKGSLFKTKEIQLSGDSVRSQQIQAFMAAVNIDWEGILATFIGNVPAHILGNSLRNSFSWGKTLTLSLLRDAEEFIKYEVSLLPSKDIATTQFTAIDKLYRATESLEKRIKHKLAKANKKTEKS
jgi:ubiquinone biosynthesis protein UbiJ